MNSTRQPLPNDKTLTSLTIARGRRRLLCWLIALGTLCALPGALWQAGVAQAAHAPQPIALTQRPVLQQPTMPMAALALRFGPLLPKLIGMNKPATYLLLVQNSD
ncbi:MAG TPA: hypothetical protein PKE45_07310, partial [Caldilineaceae bacterium]|nr:hypothetical protein [Caldilineaceae bacterium]